MTAEDEEKHRRLRRARVDRLSRAECWNCGLPMESCYSPSFWNAVARRPAPQKCCARCDHIGPAPEEAT